MQTATEQMESRSIRAVAEYQRNIGFRNRVEAVVAKAMQDHGPVNPDKADRDAYRIAVDVAANLLQMIYEEDAEISRLKQEAERYRKVAERSLQFASIPPFMVAAKSQISPDETAP